MNISAINIITNNFKNINFKSTKYEQRPIWEVLYKAEKLREDDTFKKSKDTKTDNEVYPNGKIKKSTFAKDDGSIITKEYYKNGQVSREQITTQDGKTVAFEYYPTTEFKSDEVQQDGITTKRDYYRHNKGVKQIVEQHPSGYTRIIKYYPNTEMPKERTIISANGFCQETVEYNKDGSVKKAYRQWSNGIRTKLPKDFDIIG